MNKFIWTRVVLILASIIFLSQGTAFADKYIANAGCKAANAYDSDGSTLLPSGYYIQYIWLKSGGGTKICGPTDGSGSVNPTYEEDRPKVFPGLANCNQVGYDTSPGAQSSLGNGHFYHQVTVEASSQQTFIARVWNANTINGATKYGETVVFQSNSDPMTPASENDLATFSTLFDKDVPSAPTPATAEATQGQAPTVPTVTIKCSSKIGTRYYEFKLFKDAGHTQQVGSTTTKWYDSSYHYAATGNGNLDQTATFNISLSEDARYYYWQVRAGNSFGTSASWTEGSVWVPENADPNLPVAVTDLKAQVQGRQVTLSWTAPYYVNKYGVAAPCSEYDIRISNEAIVSNPVSPFSNTNTNPSQTSSWNSAQSITTSSYISPNPSLPTPAGFGSTDTVVLDSIPSNGTYYFALKGRSASGSWSYVSNVVGVQIGTGGGVEEKTYTLAHTSGGLGINTVSIPFTPPLVQPVIKNLLELIQQINIQAGKNVVYSLGWWDTSTMKPAGYEIKYGSSTLNNIAAITSTSGLGYPDDTTAPIIKDRPYQVYVVDNATFTIRGQRQ